MPLDLPAVSPPVREGGAPGGSGLPPGFLGSWGGVLDLMSAAMEPDPAGAAAASAGQPPAADGPAADGHAETAAGEPRPRDARLVVFAADHPVARLRVSADPIGETARRAADLTAGRGMVCAVAALAGVGVRVVDMGIDRTVATAHGRAPDESPHESPDGADDGSGDGSPAPARGSIDVADALDERSVEEAIERGRAAADAAVDAGADLLIGAVCGVGVTTPTAAVTAAVTGMEPVDATGRGSGIDDDAWIRKAAAVRDALFRIRLAGTDVPTLLRVGGGPDLAALTGFIAQAAIRRTVVLVDDLPSTLCAVLAHRLAPGADAYVVASSLTPARGHGRLLELLGREPMTEWLLTAGSGVGALLTVPTLRAAWAARHAPGSDHADARREPYAIDIWDPELL